MREQNTREKKSVTRLLTGHFFRRFFDNDTLQTEGDTLITVVRAACAVAVPGSMYAFFLQLAYSQKTPRPLWGRVEDEYFFILISFVAMGLVSIFEWEMLFPDRIDFLILTPLPLQAAQMLAAKASALIAFFTIFLLSCNVFGAGILPLLSAGSPFRQMYAHVVATLCAGACAALFFLAIGSLLLCTLGAARFRMVSPVLQMLSVAALVLLLLHYAKYVETLQFLLASPQGWVRWVPPFWFLGLYEVLFHGAKAPSFAHAFAWHGLQATAIAFGIVMLTYPLAWARMRRMAVEGGTHRRGQASPWRTRMVHGVVRRAGERAVFHFIGQTMARNNRYQVYLAIYGGTGVAIAVACAVTLRSHGAKVLPLLSDRGLHAAMPLLLFWVIAGLRNAFAFPLNLSAGWVFRVTGLPSGECAAAARKWVLLCALAVMCGIETVLAMAGWDGRRLLVQVVCGVCLCVLLTDALFFLPTERPIQPAAHAGQNQFAADADVVCRRVSAVCHWSDCDGAADGDEAVKAGAPRHCHGLASCRFGGVAQRFGGAGGRSGRLRGESFRYWDWAEGGDATLSTVSYGSSELTFIPIPI